MSEDKKEMVIFGITILIFCGLCYGVFCFAEWQNGRTFKQLQEREKVTKKYYSDYECKPTNEFVGQYAYRLHLCNGTKFTIHEIERMAQVNK